MHHRKPALAVLVATADRPHLLGDRALPSILKQSYIPSRLVVVDDSCDKRAQTRRVVNGVPRQWGAVDFLHNRRTKGAAGAWNSGIDHILRTSMDPTAVHVAFLDDDDEWDAHHLEYCMASIEKMDLDMVATPFERIEGADPLPVFPPASLEASSFLVGNPGIQGSNLVCRLSVLLEAGLFDEWLPSCTDRDLCIRIADLPGIRYGTTTRISVRHFASRSRPRLSTRGLANKTVGLDRFYAKWRNRMSATQRFAFRQRADALFGWKQTRPVSAENGTGGAQTPPSLIQDKSEASLHLIVGVIADAQRPQQVGKLLADLRGMPPHAGLSGLDVLVLENGSGTKSSASLRAIVERERDRGLRVHLVDRVHHRRDAKEGLVLNRGVGSGRKLAIASARTVLQSYLYVFASRVPGAVVWIMDDDMRLNPLIVDEDGTRRRQALDTAALLQTLHRLRDEGKVDVAIGRCTGAPPVPHSATVRVQMVDLVASLFWLASRSPEEILPDHSGENAMLRVARRDYYYDLSRMETDRLETPFLVEPAFVGERVDEAFTRLSRTVERILAGEQVFRPLVDGSDGDVVRGNDGLLRGGNTFVFDIESLRDMPNPSQLVGGRHVRRSDMMWALLQRQYFGRQMQSVTVALYHDRSGVDASGSDIDRLVDDFQGYALTSALADTPDVYSLNGGRLTLTAESVSAVADRAEKYLDERLAAFRLSFYRIRGLSRVLRHLIEDERAWWQRGKHRAAADGLRVFADRLAACYAPSVLEHIERKAKTLNVRGVRAFLRRLPGEVDDHQRRFANPQRLLGGLVDERVANARAAIGRLTDAAGPFVVLGCGAEGVVFTDKARVFKVFDYWEPERAAAVRTYLRSRVGAWDTARRLYPLLHFHESERECVLVYQYEPSKPYIGGDGVGMVDLMVECHRFGVVCRNIHPDNLRLVEGRVRLIDYGSDIRPLDGEDEFLAMCRRAWLSWRWPWHSGLKDIMRRALTDSELPELNGFDVYHEAVRRLTEQDTKPEDIALRLIGGVGADTALDYGCGTGRRAKSLADSGTRVVGYDPDESLRSGWDVLADETRNLRFTHDRSRALKYGPYSLVVCRRVLCTVEDDGEMAAVLRDLRNAVRADGRVIVTLCNPHATFAGPSLETDREVPPNVGYDDRFVWQKRLRASGRTRADVHRPEWFVRRAFGHAGLVVCRRLEEPTIDLDRFERISDHIAFELRPLPPLPDVALLLKACAMDAATLEVQVKHLVAQLEAPRAFAERILVLDAREKGFLRQHTEGSLNELHRAARRLVRAGWIDRVVEGPPDGDEAAAVNKRWFGCASPRAHAVSGAQVASTLVGLEACASRYVLQMDIDLMIARLNREHDYLADMLGVFADDREALTVAFNIAVGYDRPYTAAGAKGAWRVEAPASLTHLERLRRIRPLPNRVEGERLALSWHRSLDRAIANGRGRSYRGGDRRTFYVHPPNARKRALDEWLMVLDRIEHGFLPMVQTGHINWIGELGEWLGPPRREPFVFVVCGRNVAAGRLRRCLDSMRQQRGPRWGAVVIDDASDPALGDHFEIECASLGCRCTVIRNRVRRGLLANMKMAIGTICTEPESVIVTLDADDALIGDRVLERLAAEYAGGADVTVGSMLRTDKEADYPVNFDRPREHRGGNVWQHLRSFRKRLFDAIPYDALRLDGDYVDRVNDWAYMLPIIELSAKPAYIADRLYLHEPSVAGRNVSRAEREGIAARIVAKGAVGSKDKRLAAANAGSEMQP